MEAPTSFSGAFYRFGVLLKDANILEELEIKPDATSSQYDDALPPSILYGTH